MQISNINNIFIENAFSKNNISIWEKYTELSLYLFFIAEPLILLFQSLFSNITIKEGTIGIIKLIIIGIPAIINIRKINPYVIVVGLIWLITIFTNLIFFDNFESLKAIFISGEYIVGLTLCTYFTEVKNPGRILDVLEKASYLVIVINIVRIFLKGFNNWEISGYMQFGYGTVLFWSIILQRAFIKRKVIDYVFLIITGIFLVVYGNRGVIVVMGFMMFIYALCYLKASKKIWIYLFIGLSSILGYIYYDNIILFINNTFNHFDIYSRTLSKLMNGTLILDNSRAAIINQVSLLIKEKPLIGWGIGADRTYIGEYVHNIIFELWLCFGEIIGSIMFISIISIGIYIILNRRKYLEWFYLFIPFFASSIIILLFSKSIFTMFEFNVAITLILSIFYFMKVKIKK